jgi:hypothetical protein
MLIPYPVWNWIMSETKIWIQHLFDEYKWIAKRQSSREKATSPDGTKTENNLMELSCASSQSLLDAQYVIICSYLCNNSIVTFVTATCAIWTAPRIKNVYKGIQVFKPNVFFGQTMLLWKDEGYIFFIIYNGALTCEIVTLTNDNYRRCCTIRDMSLQNNQYQL